MNRVILSVAAVAGFALALTARVHSQAAGAAKSPQQMLQSLKEANQKLIDQQNATLQKLDELQKESEQTRVMIKRA